MNEFIIIEELFLSMIGIFSVPFHGTPLILWFVGVAILMDFMKYLKIFITGTTINEQGLRDFYSYMKESVDKYYDKDIYSTYVPDNIIEINGNGINGNDISLIGISNNIGINGYNGQGLGSYEYMGDLDKINGSNMQRKEEE